MKCVATKAKAGCRVSIMAMARAMPASPALASLLGAYELVSGPAKCPEGTIRFVGVDEDQGSRNQIFGGRHNWPMPLKNKSVVKEKAQKGSCSHVWKGDLTPGIFTAETTLAGCANKAYNDVATETMVLEGQALTYELVSAKDRFQCRFKKSFGRRR